MSNKEYYSYSKILDLVEAIYAKQYISISTKDYVSIYSYALSTQTKSVPTVDVASRICNIGKKDK